MSDKAKIWGTVIVMGGGPWLGLVGQPLRAWRVRQRLSVQLLLLRPAVAAATIPALVTTVPPTIPLRRLEADDNHGG